MKSVFKIGQTVPIFKDWRTEEDKEGEATLVKPRIIENDGEFWEVHFKGDNDMVEICCRWIKKPMKPLEQIKSKLKSYSPELIRDLMRSHENLFEACAISAPVIDSFLNGQGLVSESEMDEALMSIRDSIQFAVKVQERLSTEISS